MDAVTVAGRGSAAPGLALRVVVPAVLAAQLLIGPWVGALSLRCGLVAAEVAVLVPVAVYLMRSRLSVEDALLLNATPGAALALAGVASAAASLLVGDVDLWCLRGLSRLGLDPPLSLSRGVLELQINSTATGLIAGAAAVAAVPAVAEELVFRGFLLTAFHVRRGPTVATLASATVFALAHFNPWSLPALFAYGVFLSVLVHRTHSIYPAMLAHLVTNGLSFADANLRARLGDAWLDPREPLPALAAALSGLVVLICVWWLGRLPRLVPMLGAARSRGWASASGGPPR